MLIEEATTMTADLLATLTRLVRQLSSSAPALTEEHLRQIVADPATRLLIARDEQGAIMGSLTLAMFRIPTGMRAWIEDVVVDEAARGQGVGEALSREAVRLAQEAGARTVDLTSRSDREAAHRLYARLGFEQRATNIYRLTSERIEY
jgi:ribosomal protein S18 acetylase RimI-like enzyme